VPAGPCLARPAANHVLSPLTQPHPPQPRSHFSTAGMWPEVDALLVETSGYVLEALETGRAACHTRGGRQCASRRAELRDYRCPPPPPAPDTLNPAHSPISPRAFALLSAHRFGTSLVSDCLPSLNFCYLAQADSTAPGVRTPVLSCVLLCTAIGSSRFSRVSCRRGHILMYVYLPPAHPPRSRALPELLATLEKVARTAAAGSLPSLLAAARTAVGARLLLPGVGVPGWSPEQQLAALDAAAAAAGGSAAAGTARHAGCRGRCCGSQARAPGRPCTQLLGWAACLGLATACMPIGGGGRPPGRCTSGEGPDAWLQERQVHARRGLPEPAEALRRCFRPVRPTTAQPSRSVAAVAAEGCSSEPARRDGGSRRSQGMRRQRRQRRRPAGARPVRFRRTPTVCAVAAATRLRRRRLLWPRRCARAARLCAASTAAARCCRPPAAVCVLPAVSTLTAASSGSSIVLDRSATVLLREWIDRSCC